MGMILLFLILPISTIVLFFIKDPKKTRKNILNIFLFANTLLYLFPLINAYISTRPNGNMWSENGPGAILWLYLILIPICAIIQIILLILKIVFYKRN